MTSALSAFLAPTPAADVARLEATAPIVLLPVRIETRFAAATEKDHPMIFAYELPDR